jgi:hypothetical protein
VLLRAVGKRMAEQQYGVEGSGGDGEGRKRGKPTGPGSAWEREAERVMIESWVGE